MSELFNIPPTPIDASNEWYTLSRYTDAARHVMGGIELDPASCAAANKTIKAQRYYSVHDDGLRQDWTCCSMWLNPPFGNHPSGKSNMCIWSHRLIDQYRQSIVQQAILLCMSNTEASWFGSLWNYPICFPCPRVMFFRPNGKLDHHVLGTCFVYFGPQQQKFINTFTEFGIVVAPNGVHRKTTTQQSLWNNDNVESDTEGGNVA